jgi:hypothetical protein
VLLLESARGNATAAVYTAGLAVSSASALTAAVTGSPLFGFTAIVYTGPFDLSADFLRQTALVATFVPNCDSVAFDQTVGNATSPGHDSESGASAVGSMWIAIAAAVGALLLLALIVAILIMRRRTETALAPALETATFFEPPAEELECENPLDLENTTHFDVYEIWQENEPELL